MSLERLVWLGSGALVVTTAFGTGCGDDSTGGGGSASASDGAGSPGGTIKLQINGEDLGYSGFSFPGDPTIADGWALHFDHVLVNFDQVTLSENPDKAPSDQSQTDGVVAELEGPWVADLAIAGSEVGADGDSKAILVDRIANQTKKGGRAFDADKRYAFGYRSVLAREGAKKLNLDADGETYLAKMIGKYSVMYVGTATWMGDASCLESDAGSTYFADSSFPTTVKFEIGYATPTSYLNCQNQNNDGEPFNGEEYQRGIQTKANEEAVAQITFHLDHPFFSDVQHDPALFFDQFAAALVGKPEGTVLHLEDLKGIDPTALTDAAGTALPWRTCDGTALPAGEQRAMATGSVPVSPSGDPGAGLRDYFDFVQYVQSTQGHLNGGEGLCFVKRDYPSPP